MMNRYRRKGERLAVVALAAALLWNYPLLSLFSTEQMLLGVPILYIYLFTVWLLFIAAIAFLIRRG